MIAPGSDEFSVELLAAYADGELDGPARAVIERWLADHPEAMADLLIQQELAATNALLWDSVEPPEPAAESWAAVRQGIDERLNPPVPAPRGRPLNRRWRAASWILAGLSAASAAAMIGWLAFRPTDPMPEPRPDAHKPVEVVQAPATAGPEVAPAPRPIASGASEARDPLASFAVLPMPTDDDVILDRIPALRAGWLPIGQHPVPGLLVLAAEDDVQLEEVEPSPAWPAGGPKMTTAPGDAPMIFAARPR